MFALLYQPFLSYLQFSLYNWLKRSVCSLKCCTVTGSFKPSGLFPPALQK
ncbi:TPA: hypothetical protein J1A81_004433 [Escherichia coli]|nr:hypothetical protein [Escherichia coli]HBB0930774.1 hypothetical protein [Escherichia coli]